MLVYCIIKLYLHLLFSSISFLFVYYVKYCHWYCIRQYFLYSCLLRVNYNLTHNCMCHPPYASYITKIIKLFSECFLYVTKMYSYIKVYNDVTHYIVLFFITTIVHILCTLLLNIFYANIFL